MLLLLGEFRHDERKCNEKRMREPNILAVARAMILQMWWSLRCDDFVEIVCDARVISVQPKRQRPFARKLGLAPREHLLLVLAALFCRVDSVHLRASKRKTRKLKRWCLIMTFFAVAHRIRIDE